MTSGRHVRCNAHMSERAVATEMELLWQAMADPTVAILDVLHRVAADREDTRESSARTGRVVAGLLGRRRTPALRGSSRGRLGTVRGEGFYLWLLDGRATKAAVTEGQIPDLSHVDGQDLSASHRPRLDRRQVRQQIDHLRRRAEWAASPPPRRLPARRSEWSGGRGGSRRRHTRPQVRSRDRGRR